MKLLTTLLLLCLSINSIAQVCFSARVKYQVGINPSSICHADFNGDSIEDLAIANRIGSVSILLGTGSGTFGAGHDFPSGVTPYSICSADFNNDSYMDLAVVITFFKQ